jgi:DNA-binding response OmpR family regulator
MTFQNVALPENEMDSGLDGTHATTHGLNITPCSPPTWDEGVGPHASQIRLRQILARVPDSGSYQVALVSSTEQMSADYNVYPPCAHQILFLPLTWKDISVLMPAGNGNTELGPNAGGARFGDVHVDLYRMQVVRRGKVVELTAQEFKVLKFMVLNPNRAISRDELLNHAWGYENYPCTRTVDSHVWRLRRKLESDPANPLHFRTISRVGYKFVP